MAKAMFQEMHAAKVELNLYLPLQKQESDTMAGKNKASSPARKQTSKTPIKAASAKEGSKGKSAPALPYNSPYDSPSELVEEYTLETLCPGIVQNETARLKLTMEQKTWIVTSLARFTAPADLTKEIKLMWGLEVSRQLLQCYDPETHAGSYLRPELKDLFYGVRRDYLARIRQVSTANQDVRLVELDQIYRKHKAAGNLKAAADILRQIAEEVGGKLTNNQNHNVKMDEREALASLLGVSVEALPEHPGDDLTMPNNSKVGVH